MLQQKKDELEAKRRNLEKLRVERAAKKSQPSNRRSTGAVPSFATANELDLPAEAPKPKDNIEEVVASLLKADVSMSGPTAGMTEDEVREREQRQRAAKLASLASQHNVVNINIPSKEILTYDKSCQATIDAPSPVPLGVAAGASFKDSTSRSGDRNKRRASKHDDGAHKELNKLASDVPTIRESNGADAPLTPSLHAHKAQDDEKQEILEHSSFGRFFSQAVKLMEEALVEGPGYDITINYAEGESKDDAGDKALKQFCSLFDESLCAGRAVHDMTFSKKFPDLVVVAYSDRVKGVSEAGQQGMVLVWNVNAPEHPEMVLYCGSDVLRAFFAPNNPNIILGSTYNGQIVVWDKSQISDGVMAIPTQRTPLSAMSHTLPVFCLDPIGADNPSALLAISTDGKMRTWNLNHLSEPQDPHEILFVDDDGNNRNEQGLAVTCMSYDVEIGSNTLLVGSEEGHVFSIGRNNPDTKMIERQYKFHRAPVTAVHAHPMLTTPGAAQGDFAPLFLSSSFDWSVALWDRDRLTPLAVFEDASDFVFDVKWSPSHPAVFATGDAAGQLSLWNLAADMDAPVERTDLSSGINRIRWALDGKRLAVGTSQGVVNLYNVNKDLVSNAEDTKRFTVRIAELQQKPPITVGEA
eukprot:c18456_g1_i1.p1 GENE.c18456_g1_i1~~c18456_g1_i1.p1  ORF type:complete len:639 (-),score=178.96 c18456_g1_i1:85-2001(-)